MGEDSLYIVIPAYNEHDNIQQVIDEWYPVVENIGLKSKLIVINDGSTDDTFDILSQCAESRPLLQPLTKANSGHGPTVIYGYKYAIAEGADYIFQTDSDGQTNPSEFDAFWKLRNKYDVVLGNRSIRGDGTFRAFVEKVVCFLLHLYFNVRVPDANAPFRLMKADILCKYINMLPDNYNLPNIMLTTFFVHYNENVTFREISFQPRQGGVNTINLKKILQIGWKALGDFKMFKKEIINDDRKSQRVDQ